MIEIEKLLQDLEIKRNWDGYDYIKFILKRHVKNKRYVRDICRYYELIAHSRETTFECVERTIRYAVSKSDWKYLGFDKKPSNTDFINACISLLVKVMSFNNIERLKLDLTIVNGSFEVEVRCFSDYEKNFKYESWEEFVNDKSIDDLELINTEAIEIEPYKLCIWTK